MIQSFINDEDMILFSTFPIIMMYYFKTYHCSHPYLLTASSLSTLILVVVAHYYLLSPLLIINFKKY